MALLRIATILLVCSACVLAQYDDGGGNAVPKKPLQIPGARRVKGQTQQQQQTGRLVAPATQTTAIINQRFRRPIPINRPRPAAEPIPELPVFTSGIRGSRPSAINLEQNDEASNLPIQTIQQPQLIHAQRVPVEVKPVSEENEKDEDVVQVIAHNLGAVSAFGQQGNLLTPTAASPTPTPTSSVFQNQERQDHQQLLHQQHQQKLHNQQIQPTGSVFQNQERQDHQQLLHQQHQQKLHQQNIQPVQYRPAQAIARSSAPEAQSIHQVIAPVQYRPQKPVRPQKQQQQQQQQQQQHYDRNEYDLNEARPAKQRPQAAPKKSKPQADYYSEGRNNKKPVAQVIRRYREETADGSIIWGFENDDGSFKEEMIGIDCITRGKYGYVDPDGLRREYTYETGIKCDEETQQQQDQDILNTFVDYQENKLVLPSGKTIDLSSMGKKQSRRPQLYRN